MRNLVQIAHQTVALDPVASSPCLALDSASSICFYAYDSGLAIRAISERETRLIPVAGLGPLIDLQYLPERESVCAISASGAIRLIPVHVPYNGGGDGGSSSSSGDHDESSVGLVGAFDEGVATAAWSPDRERCAIGTGAGQLTILSADWDLVEEIDLDHVASSISWRGDSSRFAAVIGSAVHLFDRNGVRIARSVDAEFQHDTMVSGAAFRPSGDMITIGIDHDAGSEGVQRRVAIVEGANCLRHGDWSLDDGNPSIRMMEWSPDSRALAVALPDRLIVYQRSNYRWYAKSELRSADDQITAMRWDPDRDLRLLLQIGNDRLRLVEFAEEVDRTDTGAVAVIVCVVFRSS